jgi:hypothetical protein
VPPNQDLDNKRAVDALKKACDEAYKKYSSSCSHAVWQVLKELVDQDTKWLEANHLVHYLSTNTSFWTEVTVDDGWGLAQKGMAVVGGLQATPNGHVIVIYPGDKIESGGYLYTSIDTKSNKPKTEKLRSHGRYPRALSTSKGPWPGAMSKGDKTVWDPWASDDTFEDVTFWVSKGMGGKEKE